MSKYPSATPRWWYGDARPPLGAHLVAALYGHLVELRRRCYLRGWRARVGVDRPVVVIGNLIAGGSGKTPLTIAMVERLLAEGFRPGVATRGYGRRDPARACWVDVHTAPADGGDEPVLIARRTGVKVRADRDRVAAAHALVAAGCDVVICDDGLQHYRLLRDIEIEVIDARRRYGNGALLPAGPLREPVRRGEACDFRVLNLGGSELGGRDLVDGIAGFGEWSMQLHASDAFPLRGARVRPLTAFVDQRVHAVAGTGDPERFFAMLRALGIAVVPHAFPDHHVYSAEDLEFSSDLPVLMTEKDAVKCGGFNNDRLFSVPIQAQLPEAFWVALLERLRQVRARKPAQK